MVDRAELAQGDYQLGTDANKATVTLQSGGLGRAR